MTLEGVLPIARKIVESVVWCTVASVEPGTGEPRSRLMHPVWWWEGERPYAYVTARRTPLKERHFAGGPVAVSCSYWDQRHHRVVIDADAQWLPREAVTAAWEAIRSVPEPAGFDPAIVWPGGPESDGVGVLRFDAFRIVASPVGRPVRHWQSTRAAGR